MKSVFADLHVHVGFSAKGRPVKMAASPRLTLQGIIDECVHCKGIGMVGVVDAVCTPVFHELVEAIEKGKIYEVDGGGLGAASGEVTLIPGAELEVQTEGKAAHFLAFFRGLEVLERFRSLVAPYITNLALSSQLVRLSLSELIAAVVDECRGLFVIAHAFTPHKGYFGNCAPSLHTYFTEDEIGKMAAIELGLSADTSMADRLSELRSFPYLSNSDAHSLENIAREYNELRVEHSSFDELVLALQQEKGRAIVANYGLDPRLGKYHRTYCPKCNRQVALTTERLCPLCGGGVVIGVYDRLLEIADAELTCSRSVPYIHQVPLQFVPGIGPATINRLLARFGTHMAVLHEAKETELVETIGEKLAARIIQAREGRASIREGAGGVYGKLDA